MVARAQALATERENEMVNIDISSPMFDESKDPQGPALNEDHSLAQPEPQALAALPPTEMGRSELAILMLQWEDAKRKADDIASIIETTVMAIAESVTVGNVKAKYSKGKRMLDYGLACQGSECYADEVGNFTTEIPEQTTITPAHTQVDWKGLAKALGVDPVTTKPGTPSVKLEVLK
jgi:hypothetical protein